MADWDAFISHASEDKAEVALPLAAALQRAGLRVWLDRQQLEIGDSLHDKINEGLANSRFGIVVLSPAFLAKRFPMKELNALSNMADVAGRKVILPVWHRIDAATLVKHAPLLADYLAADTADGIRAVAGSIIAVITRPGQDMDSGARTPLRLLDELLGGDPDRSAIVAFLASHPGLVRPVLGADLSWSTILGPVSVDLAAARHQHTTYETTWSLVQFAAPNSPPLAGTELSAEVQARVDELRALRRWVSGNLQEARALLPAISVGFRGVVVAGRRELLDPKQVAALRQYHDENPWITVRTYDWIIDAVAGEAWTGSTRHGSTGS